VDAGNFAGEEVLEASWPTNRAIIRGYRDGFRRTSPVGSFRANAVGIYDMTGNLAEWCEDLFRKEMNPDDLRKQYPAIDLAHAQYRVLRGASWGAATPLGLATAKHGWAPPESRNEGTGFRVVVAGQDSSFRVDERSGSR
jgi:formylglycine-generating enzyme required for sulfatase activity